MPNKQAIIELYENYTRTNAGIKDKEKLDIFMEQKRELLTEIEDNKIKAKINNLCDTLSEMNYEDNKSSFVAGFSQAMRLFGEATYKYNK